VQVWKIREDWDMCCQTLNAHVEKRLMLAHRKALRIVVFPFRAAWVVILIANFVVVSAVCVLFAAFIAYASALTFSYAFLPAEWTRVLWQWAAELYAQSTWFKTATITFFALLLLPVLRFWPVRDPHLDAVREREVMRLNDDLVAVRQREQLQTKRRG
jgi:hypothetical protein